MNNNSEYELGLIKDLIRLLYLITIITNQII